MPTNSCGCCFRCAAAGSSRSNTPGGCRGALTAPRCPPARTAAATRRVHVAHRHCGCCRHTADSTAAGSRGLARPARQSGQRLGSLKSLRVKNSCSLSVNVNCRPQSPHVSVLSCIVNLSPAEKIDWIDMVRSESARRSERVFAKGSLSRQVLPPRKAVNCAHCNTAAPGAQIGIKLTRSSKCRVRREVARG